MKFKLSLHIGTLLVFLGLLQKVRGQASYTFSPPENCDTTTQFFNSANLVCESCSSTITNTVPVNNNLECVCAANFQMQISMQTSSPSYFTCNACTLPTSQCNPSSTSNCVQFNQAYVASYSNGAYLPTTSCIACSPLNGASTQTISCLYEDSFTPTNVITDSQNVFVQALITDSVFGCTFGTAPNITACQALANLCVLEMYSETSQSPCTYYGTIFGTRGTAINGIFAWTMNLPMIFYSNLPGGGLGVAPESLLGSTTAIPTVFRFNNQVNPFQIMVNKYDFNGTYLGSELATSGILQICPDRPAVESSAFVFGTTYRQSCSLTYQELSDTSRHPPVMVDIGLRDVDSNQIFPIPILLISPQFPDNSGNDMTLWRLFRRFYMVDSITQPGTVRYASSMSFKVVLQESRDGRILPPYMSITYATISATDPTPASASFTIDYTQAIDVQAFQASVRFSASELGTKFIEVSVYFCDYIAQGTVMEIFFYGALIALPILGVTGLIFAVIQTSSWRRRQGLLNIDCNSLLMFLYFSLGMIANAFFIVMFGYAVVTLLIYKAQQTVTVFPPNEDQRSFFVIFTSIALAFKVIDVVGMIIQQSLADVFLIDWERPATQGNSKVSIWRSYFVANEWNEIQTTRKTLFTFQLLVVLFFLEVVGFKSLALESPNGALGQTTTISDEAPTLVYNPILRFGIAGFIYAIVTVVMVLYRILIHERFISDKMNEFADLCSVSNISMLILANRQYGYYIHGRSVHGRADTDLLDMHTMFKKEVDNLTSGRGLESGEDLQTFTVHTSSNFRAQYDRIYQPLQLIRNQPSARGGADTTGVSAKLTETVRAYANMRTFLASFIDHSLRDLDYCIKERLLLENLFDIEFQEPPANTAFFYNDPANSFSRNLFYGQEFSLFIFDVLLFTVIDYHQSNYLLAALITFLVGKVLAFMRQTISRSNLAKKTLVDKRFLI